MLGAQRLVGLVIEASEELYWLLHSTWWSSFETVLEIKEFRACPHLYAAILKTLSYVKILISLNISRKREVMPTRM